MSPRAVFIAGAHTDIGKTHVACALIAAARARGLTAAALKPVVSGFDPNHWTVSDPGRLLAALGQALTPEALDAISPWRFRASLAPPQAAKLEGRSLALAGVVGFCAGAIAEADADLVLVEGVGGVMSPIADDGTGLDLMAALGLPTVLVTGAYLGAVSHALTGLETLRGRGLGPLAVVVSEDGDPGAPEFGDTVAMVGQYAGGCPVIAAARGAERGWAARLLDVVV